MCFGETDDELVLSNFLGEVQRACIGPACTETSIEADGLEDGVMVVGGLNLQGVATIRPRGVYLVADKNVINEAGDFNAYATGVVYECNFRNTNLDKNISVSCGIFTDIIVTPTAITVDPIKSLVYISDNGELKETARRVACRLTQQ